MTNILRQHLYIALAFQSIIASDKNFHAPGASRRIIDLAQKISDFCNLYAPQVSDLPAVHLVNEIGTEEIDATIETLVSQHRQNASVVLPENEETLLKLYDRLQHRAARRVNRLLFAQMPKEKLSKHVLSQIDQESEERGLS